MSRYEEELQGKIESGANLNESDLDVRAFREVFKVLDDAKEAALSAGFADRVVAKVSEDRRRQDTRDHLWYGAGVLFLIAAFVGTILYTGYKIDLGFLEQSFLKDMSGYSGLGIFAVAFVTLLNWLDRQLLHKRNSTV